MWWAFRWGRSLGPRPHRCSPCGCCLLFVPGADVNSLLETQRETRTTDCKDRPQKHTMTMLRPDYVCVAGRCQTSETMGRVMFYREEWDSRETLYGRRTLAPLLPATPQHSGAFVFEPPIPKWLPS